MCFILSNNVIECSFYWQFSFSEKKNIGLWGYGVSEWLLFSANSSIVQLYHGENKLMLNEMMMMRSTLF